MSLSVVDLKPRIGSMLEADTDLLTGGSRAMEIRELLERRGVVVIRGLDLNDEQQLAFTRTLGDIGDEGAGEVYKVTFDKVENPVHASANYGTMSWHIDRTDTDVPPFASILSAKRLTTTGGQTEFANTYAAFEDLSEDEQRKLADLKVVHSMEAAFSEAADKFSQDELAVWRSVPKKIHPLVWHHRSGKKSLVVGTSAESIVGMDKAESEALLKRLMIWSTKAEYVYSHEWVLGDVVMWNNTGTMHRVRPYDTNAGRKLHRTTVFGDEPFNYSPELNAAGTA